MENFIRIFNTSKILHGRIIKIFCMMDYNIKDSHDYYKNNQCCKNCCPCLFMTPFNPTNVITAKRITSLLHISSTFDVSPAFQKPIAKTATLKITVTIVSAPCLPAMVININIRNPMSIISSVSRFSPRIPEPILLLVPLSSTLSPL